MNRPKLVIGSLLLCLAAATGLWHAHTRNNTPQPEILTKPDPITITLYFPDLKRFRVGTEPYEVPVQRKVHTDNILQKTLEELLKGPTMAEQQQDLYMLHNHTTDARLTFEQPTGTARVFLKGECNSDGASYTIGDIIVKNLSQYPEVKRIRIYDSTGQTLEPETSLSNSYPGCLQP